MIRYSLLALLLVLTNVNAEVTAWPGGIAFIDLGPAEGDAPSVEYNGKRVLVMDDQGTWRAAIGVSLDAETGRATITLPNDITVYRS